MKGIFVSLSLMLVVGSTSVFAGEKFHDAGEDLVPGDDANREPEDLLGCEVAEVGVKDAV